MSEQDSPIRVAQIIGKWLGGGVESVVMNYYRHIDRSKIQFDFICDEDSTNIPYDEINSLGGKVILIPPYQKVIKYHNELKKVLKDGNYKIVHSHINTLSVFSLWAAKSAGVPVRIAHSHSTTNKKEKKDYTKYLDNKKILLVDDNESSLKLINKILTKYHIKVETTNLGKKALDKIRKGSKYDLILLDEEMPYMNGEEVLKNVSFSVKADNKIAVLSDNELATTLLFQIIAGEVEPDSGEVIWGQTITKDYFPKDNSYLFQDDEILVDWLRKYSKDPDETYVRGFLGRMLFSGDEALKNVKVLSGGEKVRCVLSKLMLSGANFLIFDEPTNHLDMESITALNEGMQKFKGDMIFTSHDHQLTQTVANRIIDLRKDKIIDRECSYNEYLGIE